MKWWPSDWRGDPGLRSCAPLTRYCWFEMLLVMHDAEPYGHLLISGRAPDAQTLSRVIGVDAKDIRRAIRELRDRGVLSMTDDGVIISRRMIRDENRRKIAEKNGAKGGNPALKNQPVSLDPDNPPGAKQDITHIPDTRYQIPETTLRGGVLDPPRKGRPTVGGGVFGAAARALTTGDRDDGGTERDGRGAQGPAEDRGDDAQPQRQRSAHG